MNPFSYGRIVRGKHFYDREQECEHITNTLKNGNNVVLYAPRRYGKTSLVFKVMEQLQQQSVTTIYIDIMQAYSLESFISLYIYSIQKNKAIYKSSLLPYRQPLKTLGHHCRSATMAHLNLAST